MSESYWHNANVLITGASGFIGSRLTAALLEKGARVICLVLDHDPKSPLWLSGDIDRVTVVSGPLQRFDVVKSAVIQREIDTVFHLGAQTLVGPARRDPLTTFESNIRGTYHVLEACRMAGDCVKRIVIASSDKAYGECPALPYTESTPLAGRFPYDVSKTCCDLLAQCYDKTYDLPIAIARCGNVYGGGDLNFSRLAPGAIRSLLHGERPIIRSDGSPLRDYLYVDDAVAAYLALGRWVDEAGGVEPDRRAFNFSSGEPITVIEMVRRIRAAVGREDIEPIVLDDAPCEIAAQHLDSTRARRELAWSPTHEMTKALGATVQWYRKHLHLIDTPLPEIRPQKPVAIEYGGAS